MAAVYAQGTEVPAEKSAAEIQAMLKAVGADRIGIMSSAAETIVVFDVREAIVHHNYREGGPPRLLGLSNG